MQELNSANPSTANVGIGVVRDMCGVLEQEDVPMAGLIVLEGLGEQKERNFRREMAQAGDLHAGGVPYPRMQRQNFIKKWHGCRTNCGRLLPATLPIP